jgi:N-acetylneuraminic acid mutarotase
VRFGGALAHLDGKLYFFGGTKSDRETISTDHWMIDLANQSAGWVRKASLPLGGDHMSHAVINGIIYAVGGEHGHHGLDPDDDAPYVQHKYLLAYNPKTNQWTRKADMPIASSHFEGGTYVVNNKIVLVGGQLTGGGRNLTSAVRVYDPATNKWTSVSGSYPKRIMGQAGGYWNGRIYSTNGYSPDSEPTGRRRLQGLKKKNVQ